MSTNSPAPERLVGAQACPSDEILAAWLDARLASADAERVSEHVADCEACLALVAAIAPMLERGPESGNLPSAGGGGGPALPQGPDGGPVHGRSWSAVGLALAATLLLGVGAGYWWWAVSSPREVTGIETLRSVAVERRPTYGRLSGFPWAPAPETFRSDEATPAADTALLGAADRLARRVSRSSAPPDLHALGVAQLVAGDTDAAIETLSRAAAARPDDATVNADASSAYLQRAWVSSDKEALAEARRLAELATRKDPSLAAGWFNLAKAAQLAGDTETRRRSRATLARLEPSTRWVDELPD